MWHFRFRLWQMQPYIFCTSRERILHCKWLDGKQGQAKLTVNTTWPESFESESDTIVLFMHAECHSWCI